MVLLSTKVRTINVVLQYYSENKIDLLGEETTQRLNKWRGLYFNVQQYHHVDFIFRLVLQYCVHCKSFYYKLICTRKLLYMLIWKHILTPHGAQSINQTLFVFYNNCYMAERITQFNILHGRNVNIQNLCRRGFYY